MEDSLSANFTLKAAWARMNAAGAIARQSGSDLYPDLDARGSAETVGGSLESDDEFLFELAASYEVDLWGRIRAGVEADRFLSEAARYDYQAAAISMASEIVRNWLQLMQVYEQLDILAEQVETDERILALLQTRLENGRTRSVDVMRQRQLLEETRQQMVSSRSEARRLEHQLAVLSGRPPQAEMDLATHPLPDLPPLPDAGLPAQLIRRRPDIRGEYSRLRAADREVAVAISDRYPRIDLSAALLTSGNSAGQLFEEWARSFSASIVGPLLDAGRRRAEADRTRAVREERLNRYGLAVLQAFREVEDALVGEKNQKETVVIVRERLDLARQTRKQLRVEYMNGAGDFLDLLNALDQEQRLRRELLVERRRLLDFRLGLYRALAGGFELDLTKD